MSHSIDPQPAFFATAHRALVLAKDLTDVAARLRAAAAELLEATTQLHGGRTSETPEPRAQDAAVARGGAGRRPRKTERVLVVGTRVSSPTTGHTQSVVDTTIEDANRELAAAARYGSWQPTVRATRQRRSSLR